MKFTLPPKLAAVRKTLARNHNRRVILLLLAMMAYIVSILQLDQLHHDAMLVILMAGTALIGIPGIIYVIRSSKRQSIALGFVCPLCGGSLYDGKSNRLGFKGECPCCKQFVIERLNEKSN